MRLLITVTILLSSFNIIGQDIAKCIEIIETDSVKLYFTSSGVLIDKECSSFYRVARINHDGFFFDGASKDYFSSGQLAVDCRYVNNLRQGAYRSFYPSGLMMETVNLRRDKKLGNGDIGIKVGN